MPTLLYPPARPQSIGEVLDTAFRIFRVTLLGCLPFSVLASVASQLPYVYAILSGRPPPVLGDLDRLWWGLNLLGMIFWLALVSVIILRQAAGASGIRLAAREGTVAALRKLPALLGMILGVLAVCAVCAVPLVFLPRTLLPTAIAVVLVPLTWLGVAVSCAAFAVLIGNKGPLASIRHSVHLVRGNWWRTATIYSVAVVMLLVFYILATLLAGMVLPFTGVDDLALLTAISTVIGGAISTVGTPFYTAVGLALYGDLESRRQGSDLERRIAGATAG